VDDIEVAELLESLEALLASLGLVSIVEQERTAASEGRVVETTRADLPPKRTRDQAQLAVGDFRRVPLSSRERLKILVDLAEVAVGATFAIEERVHDFVREYFANTDEEFPWTSFRSDRSEGFVLEDDRGAGRPAGLDRCRDGGSMGEGVDPAARLESLPTLMPLP
jgi:hypothetical protein